MEKTTPHPYLGKEFIGYVLNSPFSEQNQLKIKNLQDSFIQKFGKSIWVPEPDWLHITLMDWLAPLVDYHTNKDEIFNQIYDEYDAALEESIADIGPIEVNFNKIGVGAEAIFLKGSDNGQYQKIRQNFLSKVELLPNTKRPPEIIHTTIGRFMHEIDLEVVREFAASLSISFTHTTDSFRLLRSIDTTMEAKKILKVYQLS